MTNARVLIIDDDDLVAVALYEHLLANAVAVDLATDPLRAEELMRAGSYSLIVMDAHLTGLLGERATDLLDRVRRLSPAAQIILLTAYGADLTKSDVTIVPKPQSVRRLKDLIDGFIREGRLPQSV